MLCVQFAGPASDDCRSLQLGVLGGACEISVETDLFQDVTRRYRANIMMTRLSEIRPERLPAAIKVVDEIFAKCCDVMWGHSHTAETANIRPSLDELKAEWDQLKAARDAYLAKDKSVAKAFVRILAI